VTAVGPFAWEADGHRLGIGVDRFGAGPPLLMLPAPSSICTRAELRPLAGELAAAFEVVVPDWPGFGGDDCPAVAWRPNHLRAFLRDFVVANFTAPVPIVAAGHAAAYALDLAAEHPGEVARIALAAPTWRGPLPTVAGGYRGWQERLRAAVQAPVAGPLLYAANVNRPMLRTMMKGHVLAQPERLTAEMLASKLAVTRRRHARFASAAFVTGGLDLVRSREAFLDLAQRAAVPLLAAWGPQTPPHSRAEIEALAELPGVERVLLPGGALGVHEEFPADVAAAVRPFLLRC
jgi:pimeloyl-ACP methyl ester carboxylesterase